MSSYLPSQIKLETGEIGRQANGAVMASCGGTVVYATACCSAAPVGDGSFVPLTVNYTERFSAAGRTRWGGGGETNTYVGAEVKKL